MSESTISVAPAFEKNVASPPVLSAEVVSLFASFPAFYKFLLSPKSDLHRPFDRGTLKTDGRIADHHPI